MKQFIRKLVTIILAVLLVLSLVCEAEDLIIDNSADLTLDDTVEDQIEIQTNTTEDLQEEIAQPESLEEPVKVSMPKAAVSNEIPTSISIGVEEKYTIDTSSMSGKLTFRTLNKNVATVSKKGVIKGISAGKTKITITPKNGKAKKITVTVANAPTKVTLNKKNITLKINKKYQLKATLPKKTASYKMTWKSSNKKVATVDKNGLVYAKAEGTATITVQTFNNQKATCKVTVKAAEPTPKPTSTPKPVSVSPKKITLNVGETCTVKVTHNGNKKYVSWYKGETDVVSCKWGDGWTNHVAELYIKGVNAGSAIVSVFESDTGDIDTAEYIEEISVTVKGSASTPTPTPSPTPTPTPAPSIVVNLPDTPLIVGEYSSYSGKKREYEITDISYLYEYMSYNDTIELKVYFAGNKLYDYQGSNLSATVHIGCKLYDSTGAVVDSTTVFGPSVAVGESWAGSSCYAYFTGLKKGGRYTLKVLDTN